MPQGDVAAGGEKDFARYSGVVFGRRGIPVYPGEAEVVSLRRKNFHGESVLAALVQKFADAVFVGAVGPHDVVASSELLAVEPDVRALVDAEKMELDVAAGKVRGLVEFHAERIGMPKGNVGGQPAVRGVVTCSD